MSIAPRDWDEIRSKITNPVIGAIGEPDDNGATENLGTPTAKLNAILGITPKVVCKGYMGTVFTLSRSDKYYKDIVTEITEDSISVGNDLYINVIPVPLGTWKMRIGVNGMTINTSINVEEIGKVYTFSYSSYKTIAEFSVPGTYSVKIPDDVSKIYLDAAGAGGGGGYYDYSSAKGKGGGGGAAVVNKKYTVTPGSTISVTVGTKGDGAESKVEGNQFVYIDGTDGTATVVGNLITLPGGQSGDNGGTKGGTGGGNGGAMGLYDAKGGNGQSGALGRGGDGGPAKSGYKQPGGGGGSYGSGGDAGNAFPETDGNDGSKGGGGGAAGPRKKSGDGGHGYVRFKYGIQVNA